MLVPGDWLEYDGLMADLYRIEVTKQQRDVLLRGLRFVQSSILLESRIPTETSDSERESSAREIADLTERLNTAVVVESAV